MQTQNFSPTWGESGQLRLWSFELSEAQLDSLGLPELPEGYGFKGGAARAALAKALGRPAPRVRDLDLVRVGPGSTELDTDLAWCHMPEDAAHGHGVEVIVSVSS